MKYLAQHIIILLAALAAVMLGGCVNDYDTCDEPRLQDEMQLRFTLKLDVLDDLFSRADGIWNPEDPVVPGSSFDNTIILKTTKNPGYKWLHVMLINNSTDEIAHIDLNESSFKPLGEGLYQVDTKLDIKERNWTAGEYRLMVIANFRDRPDLKSDGTYNYDDAHISDYTTLSALADKINNNKTSTAVTWYDNNTRNASNHPYIPMWGVKTIQLSFDNKTGDDAGEIKLLRALAKVKIELNKDLKDAGYTLVSAVVDRYNKRAKPCPANWNIATETTDINATYDKSFNQYNSGTDGLTVNAPGYETETEDEGSIVFYLPEREDKTTITVTVKNDFGDNETCSMSIDNYPDNDTDTHYSNKYSTNRNHLYLYTIEKNLTPGKLSYRLKCWNYANSAIGWDPVNYSFSGEGDNEAENCYVSFPSYSTDKNKDLIQNTTSFADFTFTFPGPDGAVWKAFLIENGKEYTAEDKFTSNSNGTITYASAANTPNGFFFGVGNDDKNNTKAATSGVARTKPYQVKIGSRLRTVDFNGDNPEMEDGSSDIVKINSNGLYWKEKEAVPTCYLVIKVAYDGINFTEELPINPDGGTSPFTPLKLAGTKTRIQIRHLFPFYKNKSKRSEGDLIKGKESSNSVYSSHCWWSYPEGHKDAPATTNP